MRAGQIEFAQILSRKLRNFRTNFCAEIGSQYPSDGLLVAENHDLTCVFHRVIAASRQLLGKPVAAYIAIYVAQLSSHDPAIACRF